MHKKVLDFCGIFHLGRKHSCDQEQFFWPANGLDSLHKDDLAAYKLQEFAAIRDREKSQ